MTGRKKAGMSLFKTEDTRKNVKSYILSIVSAMLACTTLILIFSDLTGFGGFKNVWPGILTGCLLCILYGIAENTVFKEWYFPAALVLLLIFVLLMRTSIAEGFGIWWNQFSELWTENTGFVLQEFQVSGEGRSRFVFLILIGSVAGLLCLLLDRYVPVLLPFVTMGTLFFGNVLLRQNISFGKMCFYVASGIFLLLYGGKKKGNTASPILIGWAGAAILIALSIPVSSLEGVRGFTENVSNQIHDRIHESRYETGNTVLPEGDFTGFTETKEERQPGLIVTGDKLEPMYLRGFTGTVFENNRWTELDKKIIAENKDLLYWIQSREFHLQSQFEKAVKDDKVEKTSVTIQNMGACSMYRYVPFQLVYGEYLEQDRLSMDGLHGDGERTYTYFVLTEGRDRIIQVLQDMQKEEQNEDQDYRKAESAYRDFVYEYYLQIPENLKEELKEEWDSLADSHGGKDALTFGQAQECVRTFLEKYFSEEGKGDVKILPLEAATGTSYQYATTAVLTLRYFGIPARYAEGYMITDEMIEDSEGSVEADSSRAGAWAEVYQDGLGWIPMILTPGLEETAQNNNPENQNDDDVVIKEGEELEEEPEEPLEEPEPEGGSMVKVAGNLILRYLKYVLALILLIAAIVIRRYILIKKKKKRFSVEDPSEAVAWIVADSVLLLEKIGLKRGNGSLHRLCEEVNKTFDEEYQKAYREMIRMNSQALFSSRKLDQESREQAFDFRTKTLQHVKTNTKWYKRIWMKWIQCLY